MDSESESERLRTRAKEIRVLARTIDEPTIRA